MKQYLLNVILVSICMGICEIIAPNIKNIDKFVKAIGLLIILCVIISPLTDLINLFDEGIFDNLKDELIEDSDASRDEYTEILNEYLYKFSLGDFKSKVQEILEEKFYIPSEESEIEVFTYNESEKIKVSEIQILLSGKSIFRNPYEIEKYFSTLLNCECVVLIKK